MGLKIHSVNLEEDTVKEAKQIIKKYGGKLSPVLNNLLATWVRDVKESQEYKKMEDKTKD